MFCTNCGNQLADGVRFCTKCGAPVGNAPEGGAPAAAGATVPMAGAPAQYSDQPAYTEPAPIDWAPPMQPAYGQQQPPQKSKTGLIVGIVAAVAVVVVLVVLFVFPGVLKGGSAENSGVDQPATQSQQQPSASAVADTSDEPTQDTSGEADDEQKPESSFDAEKAEAEAREAALDAGKQVFTGTIRVTTWGERAKEIDSRLAEDFKSVADDEMVLLELAGGPSIEAAASGNMGKLETRPDGECLSLTDDGWAKYDGETVTVAVHAVDMMYPSDVSGVLYTVSAQNVVLIAPLTEETAEDAIEDAGTLAKQTRENIARLEELEAEQAANADYLIPDSSDRVLSRSELEKLSDRELYLARNEIYARHGRMFKNSDLQEYFNAQSWYTPTYSPDEFDDNWLSQTERDNAALMLEIEKDRDSSYL